MKHRYINTLYFEYEKFLATDKVVGDMSEANLYARY